MGSQPPPEPQPGWRPGYESVPQPPTWHAQYIHPDDRGRNGFSIAGLVLGILPVLGGLLGIIFGLIGRSQAKDRGQKGRVMGTWGAALGSIWLAIIVVAVVMDAGNDAERGDDGQVVEPGQASSFTLRVGDCLRSLPADSAEVEEVDLVTCAQDHKAEVYSSISLPYPAYPGTKTITAGAERLCIEAFEPFIGKAYDDSSLDVYYFSPTARSWREGDRIATCMISGKHLVGTTKGSHR